MTTFTQSVHNCLTFLFFLYHEDKRVRQNRPYKSLASAACWRLTWYVGLGDINVYIRHATVMTVLSYNFVPAIYDFSHFCDAMLCTFSIAFQIQQLWSIINNQWNNSYFCHSRELEQPTYMEIHPLLDKCGLIDLNMIYLLSPMWL